MSPTVFECRTRELETRLSNLVQEDRIAVFSAACAERLVPFYELFSRQQDFGDLIALREGLDAVWSSLADGRDRVAELRRALRAIEQFTPHLDDFQGIVVLAAQNCCICLDSCIRWHLRVVPMRPVASYYSLESLRCILTLRETGCSDLGDSAERYAVDERLLKHPRVVSEIQSQEADLERLEKATGLPSALVHEIRQAAVAARHDAASILASK